MTPPRKARLIKRVTETFEVQRASLGNSGEPDPELEEIEIEETTEVDNADGDEDQTPRRRRGGRR
jgi:hypothetical protein